MNARILEQILKAAHDHPEQLLSILQVMGERMRAAPGWRQPTAAQAHRDIERLDRLFRRLSYGRD